MTLPARLANERPRERERLLRILIPGLAALLVITLFTLAVFTLARSREASLQEAQRSAENLGQVLEEQTARTLQAVDMTLGSLADLWRQVPGLHEAGNPQMHAALREKLASLPYARALFVLDSSGMLVHDSDSLPTASRDFSDREYFNWHRTRAEGLFIGKPIVSRTMGDWFVALSRRLSGMDGSFGGVIVAALDRQALQGFYRNIDVGRDGTIELLYQGGELIARTPDAPAWLGMPTGNSLTLRDLAAHRGEWTFNAVSPVDGVARIYSVRRVGGLPLMVRVGLSQEEALAGWRQQKSVTAAVLIAFTLATIVLAWLLMRELQRRSETSRSIAQNERLLRQVLDTLPVGVWVADRDGRLVMGNAASRKIWGVAPASGAEHDATQPDLGLTRTLTLGESSRNRLTEIECLDGSRKTILSSTAPILSSDGAIVGGIAVNEDVTERRWLADTLRESEERYRSLFRHSIDAILLMRPDGGILAANDEACRLLGYSEKELRGLGGGGIFDASDPRVRSLIEERARTGFARGEFRLQRKDGSSVPVELSSATFRDRSGEPCASMIIRDITERKRAEEHIEYLAYHDELTGIPNRAYFQRTFEHALATTQRYGLNCALMVVDLDRFKNINDTVGHQAGDQLLKQMAAQLRGCLRDSDIIARLGGDEFVILMQDASSLDAVNAVARKILDTASRPLMIDDREFLVTASIGISTYPHDGADLQTLLKNSDMAMYRAKEAGKNGFQYFSPEMNLHTRERMEIESALRGALDREEFTLHFQPKVRVSSRTVAGMEALIRWRNPDRGMLEPGDFIGIAEETGMIVPIGDWVLEEACRQGEAMRVAGHRELRIAVNLSARQLFDEDFARRVTDILEQSRFPAQNLELEITESMVMRDAERAVQLLSALHEIGVRIAIDDFGTGYSSLSYLKRFPIDCVKIDRSFIRDLPDDRDDVSITRSIIALAHNMKLEVVAEGVETAQQLEFLHAYGCDEIQGFLFSAPLAADAFESFLGKQAMEIPVATYGQA